MQASNCRLIDCFWPASCCVFASTKFKLYAGTIVPRAASRCVFASTKFTLYAAQPASYCLPRSGSSGIVPNEPRSSHGLPFPQSTHHCIVHFICLHCRRVGILLRPSASRQSKSLPSLCRHASTTLLRIRSPAKPIQSTMRKAERDLVKLASQYGFTKHRHGKHFIFKHASGTSLVFAVTDSDHRAVHNNKARLKRAIRQIDQSH